MSVQLDYGQLLKPLFAVVNLESKVLSRNVSVSIFHDLSISSLFVGFQPTNIDKYRQFERIMNSDIASNIARKKELILEF